jgi:nitroreductase
MTTINSRTAAYPIEPIFLERWSPRAFTGMVLTKLDLLTMLEAARWAPSSNNAQPWRFLFALRGSPDWQRYLDLLVPSNRSWAAQASALVYFFSKTNMQARDGSGEVPSLTHSFDAGTASGFMALQAHRMGWSVHGMAGFDHQRSIETLNIPEGYMAEAAFAIGKPGDPVILPEVLRLRERPSDRLPLAAIAIEGRYPF